MKSMLRVSIAALLLTFQIACAPILRSPGLTEDTRQRNIESFEMVWKLIHEQHFDTTFGGLDWRAVHDELKPRIQSAETMDEARQVMTSMVGRLGLSHFGIIPGSLFQKLGDSASKDRSGETGIRVCILDTAVYVQSVRPGSAAEKAGIRSGWLIEEVNGHAAKPVLLEILKEFKVKTYGLYLATDFVEKELSGAAGDSVLIRFIESQGRSLDLSLPLEEKPGWKHTVSYIAPLHVHFEAKWLDDGIGYIAFNYFLDPVHVMPAFNEAMDRFRDARGIVIDIRGNRGGIIAMGMGIAGWFVKDKEHYLGTLQFRKNSVKASINPRINAYSGPLAILINETSGSMSEIFAGGLQDMGRAVIVGITSIGASLPSTMVPLPNGDALQYVLSNYISRNGAVLEGRGVIPDMQIQHTRQSLLQGRDIQLETAMEWIRTRSMEIHDKTIQ